MRCGNQLISNVCMFEEWGGMLCQINRKDRNQELGVQRTLSESPSTDFHQLTRWDRIYNSKPQFPMVIRKHSLLGPAMTTAISKRPHRRDSMCEVVTNCIKQITCQHQSIQSLYIDVSHKTKMIHFGLILQKTRCEKELS